jgi:hypothetical protein
MRLGLSVRFRFVHEHPRSTTSKRTCEKKVCFDSGCERSRQPARTSRKNHGGSNGLAARKPFLFRSFSLFFFNNRKIDMIGSNNVTSPSPCSWLPSFISGAFRVRLAQREEGRGGVVKRGGRRARHLGEMEENNGCRLHLAGQQEERKKM